jgi:hypothetical protein
VLRAVGHSAPVVNTKPVRASDYSIETQCSGPATLPAMYHNLHRIALVLSGEPVIVRDGGGIGPPARLTAGEASITAAGPGRRVRWPMGIHCLYVHLHPRLLRRLSAAGGGPGEVTLRTLPRLRDRVLSEIGFELHHLLRQADRRQPGDA